MQTFSYMQRSGDDDRYIKRALFFIFLYFIYEPLTTIYPYMPPLLAVASWYMLNSKKLRNYIYWALYLLLYEFDHNLPFLSLFISVVLLYYILKSIKNYINCGICLIVLNSLLFYAIFLGVLIFYTTVFSVDFYVKYWLLALYSVLDLVILVVYAL